MQCKVTNESGKPFSYTFGNGQSISLMPGESQTLDLSGDRAGFLEASGLVIESRERDAGPPKGSKAWAAKKGLQWPTTSKDVEEKPAEKPVATVTRGGRA